jgi:hypothetical protein
VGAISRCAIGAILGIWNVGIEKRISVGGAIARCAIGAMLVFQMLELNDDLLSSFTHHLNFSNLHV